MSIEIAGALYVVFLAVFALWSYGRMELQKKVDPANALQRGEVESTHHKNRGTA